MNYQLHTAKFPHQHDLIHFYWTENPLLKGRIEQLATSEFMIQANNLIFVGGTGTGKEL
ncbi:MAG: ATP-binding protein [Nitrosomonas sp.]|nr:ATP-binding protein [Nitrosomonas sp.]